MSYEHRFDGRMMLPSNPFSNKPQPRLSNSDTAPTIPLKESSSAFYDLFLVNFDQPHDSTLTTTQTIDIIYRNYDQDGIWRFVISGAPFNPNHIVNSIVPLPPQQSPSRNLAIEIQKEVRQQMSDLALGFEVQSKVNDSAQEEPNKRARVE